MPDGGDGRVSIRPARPSTRHGRAATRKRNQRRRVALRCTVAGGDARVIPQQVESITRRCASDCEGIEIKRQLNGFDFVFAMAVHDMALGLREDGTFERTWENPQSRRLATLMIFLAYSCDESTFRGRDVYRVRGYSVGTLGFQTTVRWCANARYDADGKPIGPHINTTSRDLALIRVSGLLLAEDSPHAHQFDARKLLAAGLLWLVGPPKTQADGSPMLDKHGEQMQFAFNHYYLTINPFASGTRSRCRPGRFDHPFTSPKATGRKHQPADAMTHMGRVVAAQAQAEQRRADKLAARLAATDAARGIVAPSPDAGRAQGDGDGAQLAPGRRRPIRRARPVIVPTEEIPPWENAEFMARVIARAGSDPP